MQERLPMHHKQDAVHMYASAVETTQNLKGDIQASGSRSKPHTALHLLDLPNEILAHAFGVLDSRAPSSAKALAKPDYDLTHSEKSNLKRLSLVNKRLRDIVLPLLFRHARLDPYHLSAFLRFIEGSDLIRYVDTVTAKLSGPCSHLYPAWWSRLLERLPHIRTLTVLAAPHVFAEIGQVPIETCHSWAFKINYHSITLTRSETISSEETAAPSFHGDQACLLDARHSLLTTQPWTSFAVNESSFLPAYSTYEYFLKVPPSLVTSLFHRQQVLPQLQSNAHNVLRPQLSVSTASFLNNLTSFSYTAIFPFYNHVDEILKCIRQMSRLRKLFIKLCPEPESSVLQDEMERNEANAGRIEGRIDVNDPWNEFETSYMLIPHTIIYLTTDGCLEEFQTDDVKMVGIRDKLIEDIDKRLESVGCWSHVGDGVWKRNTSTQLASKSAQDQGGDHERYVASVSEHTNETV